MKHTRKQVAPVSRATQTEPIVARPWSKNECRALLAVLIGFEALIFALYCVEVAL